MKLAAINFGELESITAPNFANAAPAEIINALMPYIFFIAGVLLLIYLILGGYQYIFSRGEPGATAAARGKITNAIIGLIIVLTAYWIVQVVAMFFGIQEIGFGGGGGGS